MRASRILAAALAALVAAPLPAHAWIAQKGGSPPVTTTQEFMGGTMTAVSSSGTRHWPIGSSTNTLGSAVQSGVFAVPGHITALKFRWAGTLSSGQVYGVALAVNGSTSGTPACSVSSTSSICDWTGSFAVNAGDYVEVQGATTAGTPTGVQVSHSVLFQPTTANDTVLFAGASAAAFSTSAVQGVPIGSNHQPAAITSTSRRHGTVPDGGTIDKLYVASAAPGTAGSGDQYAYAVLKNGAATSTPNCAILNTATACNDTATAAVSVAGPPNGTTPGDDVEFQASPTNADAALVASTAGFGLRYVPNTAGHYPLNATTGTALVGSATSTADQFLPITLSNGVVPTAEANAQGITHAQTLKDIVAKISAAPGASNSWQVILRVNGADTGETCTISGTNTGCFATATVAASDNDLLDYRVVMTNGGAAVPAAQIGVSMLATR